MHNEFMAFINDEQTAELVRSWADKQGFPSETVRTGGPDLFMNLLESDAPPKFVLIDFDGTDQPIQLATRLVSLCGPSARLVALGAKNDVTVFRGMLGAGMNDYLVKPLTPEILTQTMMNAARGASGVSGPVLREAKTIVFIGVRGGVGASTLATNTTWLMSHELKKKCALLDLDLQYGTSALALDIEPGHGLRDVLSSPQRVDGLMIAGAIINESDSFVIMSAEEAVEEIFHVDPNAVMALLKEMKSGYNAIVIDMPRHLISTQKRVLATAHEIVLVTEMSLVGIRDALRIRSTLKTLGSSARILQVATKIGPQRPAAVDEATFAKGTQAKIDLTIPDDHKAMVVASNAGKPLGTVAPSSPATKAMRELAKLLIITEQDQKNAKDKKSGGFLGGLLGSKPKGETKA